MARKAVREISLNGNKYLSLNFASSLCGYSKDYLGQLIRKGEIQGTYFKNSWFIEKEEYARFCEKNGIALQEAEPKTSDVKPLIGNASDPWDRLLLGSSDDSSAIVSAKAETSAKFRENHLLTDILQPSAAFLPRNRHTHTHTHKLFSMLYFSFFFQQVSFFINIPNLFLPVTKTSEISPPKFPNKFLF